MMWPVARNLHSVRTLFSRAWIGYETQLQKRPVITQMCSTAVLWGVGDIAAQRLVERCEKLDKKRTIYTAAFGASFIGPVGHYWYMWLDTFSAKLFHPSSLRFLAFKVFTDSLVLGPLYVVSFFAFGSFLLDNQGWEGLKHKMKVDFLPTYMAELAVWPAVQAVNFKTVPVRHQLLVVNLFTLLDATFLSWARNQDDWLQTLLGNAGDK